ncbi:MAG: hypothetical protein ACI924_000223 [Flavobacterium sp.]|jgi:hypothetical protein
MEKNKISDYGEFQLKEIADNEFVVACTTDGLQWVYYVVYTNLDKVSLVSIEMESKLTPPY